MGTSKSDLQSVVSEALANFVQQHIPAASLECVDDIVLSYVVGILEDLGEDEDGFDVEGFTEMLGAYIPEFADIKPEQVCEWIFGLASELAKRREEGQSANGGCDPVALLASQMESALRPRPPAESEPGPAAARTPRLSETSEASSDVSDAAWEEELRLLADMFPAACALELRHCLALAGGALEEAAQLLLTRQEAGDAITQSQQMLSRRRADRQKLDDKSLKAQIIAKYSYQDVDDSRREHKPHLPKSSPKKMVRYLDNKVVSLKGERFTEIKRAETKDDMKKTYVSLKPLKQYRFH
ncbi:CUE domain-containing protein 2-like [Pollicipes pollicipes]|uniref:CUE domain-containing protein 2-like n=1 Tax=Pollicipes pollicipes TaxID=41117 RepID=UPI001884F4F0|nr:CUE domain-containing protein 2-like [Pollicipes pollicipes]XP_037087187.1 CUE domain-containing protein 2-like [Pollicipes pollicipes]XP_037087188.1 CUE domain-containing protein 2-like [Pollicipes pollicipes]XP_037087979.1 CUE domain-containing protein 2-like [Pollicipes pollicipes]XP_037087980.1 CUE domain-containing protein 2-like [Pollicipes pollicipes]XP_037087981.1 CUE domain-containing protein 2-like [Pollicipes pollicipes]